MRITIIELSPEELNVIGMAEELPEVSDKSNPGHPKKYPSSLRYAVASPTPGEAGGGSSSCHGGSLRRRNGSDGNFKKWGLPQKYPKPRQKPGGGSSNAADGNFWGKG